jgi:hypothetical protein
MYPAKYKRTRVLGFLSVLLLAAFAVAAGVPLSEASAAPRPQKGFASVEEAASALVAAAETDNVKELIALFGPDSKSLVSSGDPVEDRYARRSFAARFRERHGIEMRSLDVAVILVGKKDYPYPIPLVREGGVWVFDTRAGKEEMINRRIGKNELGAIGVLRAYVEAQREYAAQSSGEFARKLVSSPGKRDGLYWQAGKGEAESPFGPLIAAAAKEGYKENRGMKATPYNGYFYRILTAQGAHAPGGAQNYIVNGKMTKGFALVAYPAKYDVSGIMTFLVNQDGVVFERNLGRDTERRARSLKLFDPGAGWKKTAAAPAR